MKFEVFHEERTPIELKVTGEIPEYALGVLYRTGPGGYQTTTDKGVEIGMSHWFDAFAQTHRFNLISPTKVLYNSRHTCDAVLQSIRETGKIPSGFSFAQRDPCQNFFRKFMATFAPRPQVKSPDGVNISVTVSTDYPGYPADEKGRSLYVKTDAAAVQRLDPETLEPVGLARQAALHPDLTGPLSASHSRTCPVTGDVFNYNLTLGHKPIYRIFKVAKNTGKTDILATINDAPGAYIHSFFLTPRYVVICVWGSHYACGGIKMLYHRNIIDALEPYDPRKRNMWYVIDRTDSRRGVVSSHPGEPFFAFHTVNAWEEGEEIVAEVPVYGDLDVLKKFYVSNLKGDEKSAWEWVEKGRGVLTRWRMDTRSSGSDAVKVWERGKELGVELPTINPNFVTLPHRFTYGLLNRCKSTLLDAIVKYDSRTHTTMIWEEHAHTPGECIFVPSSTPDAAEDDGVLLTVVLDGRAKRSYLLVLDARDLSEVARAEMETAVGLGFHGKHVGRDGPASAEF
ncbi:carotenoid oxygenase [Morchella snyderi]|nr:carotenoid oxygenase [Morchella snyderi]